MTEVVVGIRLTADASGLHGEVKLSQEELNRLGQAAQGAGAKANTAFRDVPSSLGAGARAMGAFRVATDEASSRIAGMVGGLGVAGRALAALGPVGLAVGATFAVLTAAAAPMVAAFAEAERSAMRLQAMLQATGNASGLLRSQIGELADDINDTTIFDDDQAREAIATLTTFGKVHGEIFKGAIKVAADYAAATGRDLPAAAEIIGRALQEPAEGLGALNRQLRLFDEEQQKAIERMVDAGDADRARGVILDALKDRFAGVASEMRGGIIGATGELKKALANLSEDLGSAIAKALGIEDAMKRAAKAVNDARKSLEPQSTGDQISALLERRVALQKQIADLTEGLSTNVAGVDFRARSYRQGALDALNNQLDEAEARLNGLLDLAREEQRLTGRRQANTNASEAEKSTAENIAKAKELLNTLDPLSKQTLELAANQELLNKVIAATGDPLGVYKSALDQISFRLASLKDQVGQFLDAQQKAAALLAVPAGAERFKAQAVQGVVDAGEARGRPAGDKEKVDALANALKILAGQARDTADALDIQSAGTLRLAAAQGQGGAAVREVEKALKIEAEVLKSGEASRARITAAVTREFEARKQLASSTFDASMDRRIAAALKLAEAELKGAAAVAEATLQNKVADQVQAEGAEGDKERIAQIEARIRAEQRLIDLGAKRNELDRQKDELALAEKELELVSASVEVRTRELAIFAARQRLAQDGKQRTQEEIDAYVDLAAKIADVRLQTDRAKEAQDLWLEPFRNAIKGIQDAFAKAFESMFSGGVRSFGDLAKTVKTIMVQMAAQIAALMVFRPVVGNVLSSLGASTDFIRQLVPGFSPSSSSSAGGLGLGDIFGSIKNLFSGPGDFLANAFPSLFGTTTVAGISLSGAALGVPGSALLGAGTGIPIAGEVAALGAGAPLAGILPFLGVAAAVLPLLFSMMKKPSVGPGGGVNLGYKNGAYDITSGEQDNGFSWRGTAKPWGEQVASAFKSILGDIGAEVTKAADLGIGYDAGKKKYYASYNRPDTGASERQWFDDIGEAAAQAVRFGLMKSDLSGVGPIVAKVLANSTAKSLEELQGQLRFGESFNPTIEIWNAGIGSMTEQAIAFKEAAKAAAKAEADRIESFLKNTDELLNNRDATTTRTEKRRLTRQDASGEHDQSEVFTDTADGGHSYTVVGGTTDRLRLVDHTTGEFVDAIRDATTGLYTFEKTITETSQASDTPSEEQVKARAAAKNRALSLIGLGPEVEKPLEGWSAAMAQAKAQIEAATPILKAAGFTAEEAAAKIAEGWTKKLGELRDDYDKASGRRLNDALGRGGINTLDDLKTGLGKEYGDIGRLYATAADQRKYSERANSIFAASVDQVLSGMTAEALDAVIQQFGQATDDASKAIVRQAEAAKTRIGKAETQAEADRVATARLGLNLSRWTFDLSSAEQRAAETKSTLLDLVNEEIERTRSMAAAYRQVGEALGGYRKSLLLDKNLSPLSQLQRLNEAERQFNDVAGRAQNGDVKAMGELQGISQAYLEASRDYYASSTDYFANFQKVQAVLANTESVAEREARVQDQALQTAQAQLAQVTGINQNTQTIAQAMANWQAAQTALGTARTTVTGQQWTAFQQLASDYQRDYYAETTSEGRRGVTERYGQMRDTLLNAIQDVELLQRIGQTYYTGNTTDPGAVLLRSLILAKGQIPAFAMGGVAEGWFTAGERGPELLYAGSPTRVFDHDTSKRLAAGFDTATPRRFATGNDNSETNGQVVVAIDIGARRVVDAVLALHRTVDDRLGEVISAVNANTRIIAAAIGDQGRSFEKVGNVVRIIAARN